MKQSLSRFRVFEFPPWRQQYSVVFKNYIDYVVYMCVDLDHRQAHVSVREWNGMGWDARKAKQRGELRASECQLLQNGGPVSTSHRFDSTSTFLALKVKEVCLSVASTEQRTARLHPCE